jgi:hypothetical protein
MNQVNFLPVPVCSLRLRIPISFLAKGHQKQTLFEQGLDSDLEWTRRPKNHSKRKKIKTASFKEQDAFSGF